MLRAVASLVRRADQKDSKANPGSQQGSPLRKTILIVEDNDQVRTLLRRCLQDDYEIVETGDPREALGLAMERKPNCVLLDLNMPRFSGIELGKLLSDVSATHRIPIIVITAEPAARYREVCEAFGAVEYIEKPLDLSFVKQRVSEVVQTKDTERRRKARLKLKVGLLLTGKAENGMEFQTSVVSDDLSAGGFSCSCTGALPVDSIVEVVIKGRKAHSTARARVVRVERRGTLLQRYGFEFVMRPTDWIVK